MSESSFEFFGKYLLLHRLATGGMAEVFLARPATPEANGRFLVIKRILPHIANDSAFMKMFRSETQICMGFDHPNTVHMHDFGQIGQQLYIGVEYIEGKNLRQLSEKCAANGHKVPVHLAVSLIAQAAAGLHYAHTFENRATGKKLEVIHRDITPHNLIVSYGGNLKIIDFGIAKAALENVDHTQTGAIKGKAGYVSPEQIEGRTADARSDIFALGIILWELLAGRRLFVAAGENDMTVLARIKNCDTHVQPPSRHNSMIPTELDTIVLKALSKRPGDRYASAAELQKALREFMLQFQPTYSFADVGTTVSRLFAIEIEAERKRVQEINESAQRFLTEIGEEFGPELGVIQAAAQGEGRLGDSNQTALLKDPTGGIWFKMVQKLKKENRRATFRDYVLLLIYIVTLVGLRLDDGGELFGKIMGAENEPAEIRMSALERKVAAQPALKKIRKVEHKSALKNNGKKQVEKNSSAKRAKIVIRRTKSADARNKLQKK